MQKDPQMQWKECLNTIRVHLSEKQFNTWFLPITLETYNSETNTITLKMPSSYVKEYIEEHFASILGRALVEQFGRSFTLLYKIYKPKPMGEKHEEAKQEPQEHIPQLFTSTSAEPEYKPSTPQRSTWKHYLDPHYSFETFIKGESNAVALSVSLSIAEHPLRRQFNPMFLFGPSGCGKTHLINAIGLRIAKLYEGRKVLYVAAKDFEVQYTSAQYNNKINDFIHFYQSIDVLIVDDIQSWSGKKKTLETFFYIFNHLFRNGKRIILACDRPPAELEGMEERLLTRFSWGVVEELGKPNIQLCIDILNNKIRRDGLQVPTEVINLIAEKANGSVRYLEGILNTLYAFSINKGCEIDVKFAEDRIKKLVKIEDKDITIDQIMDAVCKHFDVTASAIGGRSRKKDFVTARQVVMFLVQKHMNMPTARIGRLVGGRDHSTVIHSCSQIEKRLKTDKEFIKTMQAIEKVFIKK